MPTVYANLGDYDVIMTKMSCVGIHLGRVEPASPIELTTSRTKALQAPDGPVRAH